MTFLMDLITIPNTLLLVLIMLAVWVLFSASRSNRFHPVDMLLDEHGKSSSSRLAVFVAMALSTFMLAYVTINKSVGDETLLYMYGVYILTWAGSKTLEKGLDVWMTRPAPSMRGRSGGGYRDDRYSDPQYDYYQESPFPRYPGNGMRGGAPRMMYDDEQGSRHEQMNPIPKFTPMETPAKLDLAEPEEGQIR